MSDGRIAIKHPLKTPNVAIIGDIWRDMLERLQSYSQRCETEFTNLRLEDIRH